MASQDPIDAKFEALESQLKARLESLLEDKLRTLFAEFKIGQPPSPTKFQQGESLERPPEKEGHPSDMLQPCMRVDFPRWEEGDSTGFDIKVTDERILKCDRRCPQVKLLLQDQEINAYFFLLPLEDYEAVLGIEWLMTLGDVS
ncbi:hypothetical protein GW17_00026730 [Ensete ventricosum]|uniref:Uncharacterized protein n=1 Tax=Ensete ventricosum TaxID=4639 RepID=A0A444EHL3_ENSVE|nr:hypothetical protein GW17_00026730 [Ensete ventricosum]RZR71355.1 hypothetical protein BHM03_00004759 [Ensete ventricosum]